MPNSNNNSIFSLNNLFAPSAVQTPDAGVQTSSGAAGVSSSAATPPASILNRAESFLGISTTQPNAASVQSGNPATSNVANISSTSGTTLKSFVANALDTYDNITYNFRMYLAPESQLLDMTKLPTGPLYVVAQSGVTGNFYIKDVEIESVVGPTFQTKNTRSTSLRMTIVEPQGVSLVDKLISACNVLGIKNVSVCPMCIELTFKGYTTSGQNTQLNNLTRTFRAQLIDVQTNLNEGGAEYHLDFMLLQDLAFSRLNNAAIIQQQISVPVTTVGQFFTDLANILNEQSKNNNTSGQIPLNKYKFIVSPDMTTWVVGQSPQEKNVPSMFIESGNTKSIVLNTDMTLQRIVDVILSSTAEGNKMVNPSSKPLDKMDNDALAPKISQIATITSKVEYNGFNTTANDYNRSFTYYITKYDSYRANIDKPNSTDQDARAQYLLQDALQKKYEYIFTGQNTDILHLDLNLNNLWRAANYYYATNLQRPNTVNSKYVDPKNKTSTVISADDLRETATQSQFAANPNTSTTATGNASVTAPSGLSTSSMSLTTTPATVNPSLAAATTLAGNASTSSALLATSGAAIAGYGASTISPVQGQSANTPGGIPVISGSISRLLPSSISGPLSSLLGKPTSTSSTLSVNSSTSPTSSTTLIETLSTVPASNSSNSQPAVLSMYTKQIDNQLDTTRIDSNLEETTLLGRSIFGIVTDQLYNVKSKDLLRIDLEIRGDPFWLGESDIESFARLNTLSTTVTPVPSTGQATPTTPVSTTTYGPPAPPVQTSPTKLPIPQASTSNSQATISLTSPSKSGFANFLRGENCLFLTFQTPKTFNESTGFVDLQQADLFIGVYSVIKIIHTFADGKFTQKLDCQRDLQTDPKVIAKYANVRSSNSAKSTVNTGSSSLLSSILGKL